MWHLLFIKLHRYFWTTISQAHTLSCFFSFAQANHIFIWDSPYDWWSRTLRLWFRGISVAPKGMVLTGSTRYHEQKWVTTNQRSPSPFLPFLGMVVVVVFWDKVLLHRAAYLGTYYVDQASLKIHGNPPASASWVLGLQASATKPYSSFTFS